MKKTKKVWGHEEEIVNLDYCGKRLVVKRGWRSSLHFHKVKDETFYLVRGRILMELEVENDGQSLGIRKFIMNPEDFIHIEPGALHRFTGLTDAQIMEFSTHHDDSDSFRIEPSGKAQLRVAYDFDGVVSNGVKPEAGAPLITGRSWEERNRIGEMMDHPIYFNPVLINDKTIESEIAWKVEMIKRLEIEIYYEDSPEIITALRKHCPNCQIVKV